MVERAMDKLDEQLGKGVIQGLIALILVCSLCYIVVFGGPEAQGAYRELFGNVLLTGIGFYFGRETKTR